MRTSGRPPLLRQPQPHSCAVLGLEEEPTSDGAPDVRGSETFLDGDRATGREGVDRSARRERAPLGEDGGIDEAHGGPTDVADGEGSERDLTHTGVARIEEGG